MTDTPEVPANDIPAILARAEQFKTDYRMVYSEELVERDVPNMAAEILSLRQQVEALSLSNRIVETLEELRMSGRISISGFSAILWTANHEALSFPTITEAVEAEIERREKENETH